MGRGITGNDTSTTATVAVNKEFAKVFFHGENPIGQHFGSSGPDSTADFEIVGDHLEGLTRQTLASINPNLTLVKFQTFDQQIAGRFAADRMIARLTMLLGGLGLLLATVGLHGVTATP